MSEELKVLYARRKTFFMEDLTFRRKKTLVDVQMDALKSFANKQIYDLEDSDVLDSGRTRVEQGLAGVLPKQAVTMTKGKMDKFMTAMGLDIQGRRGITRLRMKGRGAMYVFCFTAIKRLAGAGHMIAPNTIRIPINEEMVFNCTWDKTLRMGVHCFGFLCVKGVDRWCAH